MSTRLLGRWGRQEGAGSGYRQGLVLPAWFLLPLNELIKLSGLLSEPSFQSVCAPCSKTSMTGFIHSAFWLKVPQQVASAQQKKSCKLSTKRDHGYFPCPMLWLVNLASRALCIISLSPLSRHQSKRLCDGQSPAGFLLLGWFGLVFFALFQVLWGFGGGGGGVVVLVGLVFLTAQRAGDGFK